MRHLLSNVDDLATALVLLGAAAAVIWRALHRLTQIVALLGRIADLPETVAAHSVQLADHEVRLVAVETVHRTIETTTYTRAVEQAASPIP